MPDLIENRNLERLSEIETTAIKLAIIFSEEKDIPSKYKKNKKNSKKAKSDTLVQTRFDNNVKAWMETISRILKNIETNLAWRFITINPKIIKDLDYVAEHDDFIEFTNYLTLRRDVHICDNIELGCLAQLHTAFQREIEKEINNNKPDFVSIDFEYATRSKGSVCSVGIVSFKGEKIIDEYYTLIRPPHNEYEWMTIKKHKINSTMTEKSPEFKEIYPEIRKRLKNNTIIAHGAFHTDKHCLEQAMAMNNIFDNLKLNWVCTHEICQSKLNIACKVCNIELNHHQALSDAKACGQLYNLYKNNRLPFELIQEERLKKTEIEPTLFSEPLRGNVLKPDFENAKNKNNPFFKKKVVVTGFDSILKKELARELKTLGADVDTSVVKKTNFLIIGDTPGPSKIKKMKLNIDEGKDAAIITFDEYEKMKNTNLYVLNEN